MRAGPSSASHATASAWAVCAACRPSTLDGEAVSLHANLELPIELPMVAQSGATGIGLLRTEFLFMNRDTVPTADEQTETYRQVDRNHGRRPRDDPRAGLGR